MVSKPRDQNLYAAIALDWIGRMRPAAYCGSLGEAITINNSDSIVKRRTVNGPRLRNPRRIGVTVEYPRAND